MDHFPPGVPPATTRNILRGAYHWAKIIEAAESAPTGFQREVHLPGAPKVSYHPLCTPNRPLSAHYFPQCHHCQGLASSMFKARPLHKLYTMIFLAHRPPAKQLLASSLQYCKGGCREIIYCSRKVGAYTHQKCKRLTTAQCQVADWKKEPRPHKLWCARDKV